MLLLLPVETLLSILSYLPISDINSIQQSCKRLDMVVCSNRSVVYKMAAHLHGYASESSSMEILRQKRRKKLDWIKPGDSWFDYCKSRHLIESHWKRDFKLSEWWFGPPTSAAQIFLLDEEDGVMLLSREDRTATQYARGYAVYSLSAKTAAFKFITDEENELAGFSNGYLLFKSRSENLFKIWKRSTDPLQHDPSVKYRERLTFLGEIDLREYQLRHTCFQASRLVAITSLRSLIVYNVKTNLRLSMFHPCLIIDIPLDAGEIHGLDSNADHFFLLTNTGIHVYDFSSGERVFRIWESTWHKVAIGRKAKGLTHQMFNMYTTGVRKFGRHSSFCYVHPARGPSPKRNAQGINWGDGKIRVSESGIVVYLIASQTLIIIPEYKPMILGESTIDNGTWPFNMVCSGLAIGGNRVVCNGHPNKTYIFNFPFREKPLLVEILEPAKNKRNFKEHMTLTETSLWFMSGEVHPEVLEWNFSQLEEEERERE